MLISLSRLLDDLSEINKKISLIELSEKFSNTYRFCNRDLNKFSLLLRKALIPMNTWIAGKNLMGLNDPIKNHFIVN